MELKGRRRRRRKQLLDDLKETGVFWQLGEESLDRTVWRSRFGSCRKVGYVMNELRMKSDQLSANIKFNPTKTLIRSLMTCLPAWEFGADMRFEIVARANQDSSHDWQLPKEHAEPRFACGSKNS
jgi:hypothetical protein